MLATVIESVASLREKSRLLSAEELESGLGHVMPCVRGQAGCEFIQVAELEVADSDKEQVIRWFRSLTLPNGVVNVYWVAQREGIQTPLDVFVSNYDDLWFPSSHDVVVEDQERRFLLILDHEEHFSFWKRCERRKGIL